MSGHVVQPVQRLYRDLPPVKLPRNGHVIQNCEVLHVEHTFVYVTWSDLLSEEGFDCTVLQRLRGEQLPTLEPPSFSVGELCLLIEDDAPIDSLRCEIEWLSPDRELVQLRAVDCGLAFCNAVKDLRLCRLPASMRYAPQSVRVLLDVFSTVAMKKNAGEGKLLETMRKLLENAGQVEMIIVDSYKAGMNVPTVNFRIGGRDLLALAFDEIKAELVGGESSGEKPRNEIDRVDGNAVNNDRQVTGQKGALLVDGKRKDAEEEAQKSEEHQGKAAVVANESGYNLRLAALLAPGALWFGRVCRVTGFSDVNVIPSLFKPDLDQLNSDLRRSRFKLIPADRQVPINHPVIAIVGPDTVLRAKLLQRIGDSSIVWLIDYERTATVQEIADLPSFFHPDIVPPFSVKVTPDRQQCSGLTFSAFKQLLESFPFVLVKVGSTRKDSDRPEVCFLTEDGLDVCDAYNLRRNLPYDY